MPRIAIIILCFMSQCVHAQFSLSYEAFVRKGLPVDTIVMNEYENLVFVNDTNGRLMIVLEKKTKTTFWQWSVDGSTVGVQSVNDTSAQYGLIFQITHIDSSLYQISSSEVNYRFSSQKSGIKTDYTYDNLGLLLKTKRVVERKFDLPLVFYHRIYTTTYQSDLDAEGNGIVKVFENDVFSAIYLVEKFIVVSVKMIE